MKTTDKLNTLRSQKKHLEKTIAALSVQDFTQAEKQTLLEIYEARLKKYDATIALELDVIDMYTV